MDTYTKSAECASRAVTETFSTSFSSASKLFGGVIKQDIYNIYGLVRVADEIVDTYMGKDTAKLLTGLEEEVYRTLQTGFSTNIIVHAFCATANRYGIEEEVIAPFFESMRMDISKKAFSQKEYETYIYGSAEVIGLMCLRVFVQGDNTAYDNLQKGARALGAAFQKVNFLRDIKDDYETRGRYYFPVGSFKSFNDGYKDTIIADIDADFATAQAAIAELPTNSRRATLLAYKYYAQLLVKLKQASAKEITQKRIRVSGWVKFRIWLRAKAASYVN